MKFKKLYILLVIFPLIFAIILYMDTWGLLPKSQTESQTINEAIAEAIAIHEADPTAHMGAGESIDEHRKNDVLDHPAGATLADKWTMSELDFSTLFSTADQINEVGSVVHQFPGVYFSPVGIGTANSSGVNLSLSDQGIDFNSGKDFLAQLAFKVDTYSNGHFIFNFGWDNGGRFDKNGVGVEIINGVANFYASNYNGDVVNELYWPTYSDLTAYIIRLQYNSVENLIHVYINGEELGTLEFPESAHQDPAFIRCYSAKSSSPGFDTFLYSLFFSLKL